VFAIGPRWRVFAQTSRVLSHPSETVHVRRSWPWLFFLVVLVFVAVTFRPVIDGDGVGYYAYLHAALVSHSFDFGNEYSAAIASHVPLYLPLMSVRTPAGHLADFFPVGSAILSAPAYLVALVVHPSGEPQYGSPFVEAFTLASLLYGLIALAICYRLAAAIVVSRRAALMGVVGATVATPFVYYLLTEPSYSHTFSVFCVSAFLYVWWKGPHRSIWSWFGLGLLGGLMAMTRIQDGLIAAIVLIDFRRFRWSALAFLPGLLIGFAPQLAADQVQFGDWLPHRFPGQVEDLFNGHYLNVLFSSRDGLFVWAPAAIVAAAGFYFVRDRRMQVACVLAFVVETLVIGAASDTSGASFGPRRFLDLIPFAVVGIAAVAARIGPRFDWVAVGALCAWNLLLIASYEYVVGPSHATGYGALIRGQGSAVQYVPRLFAKGAVVRDLVLWAQAHTSFDPIRGVALFALEAACLAIALAAAIWPGGPKSVAASEALASEGQ
jgi:hypothetical protein